jgi:hypothetical protein
MIGNPHELSSNEIRAFKAEKRGEVKALSCEEVRQGLTSFLTSPLVT